MYYLAKYRALRNGQRYHVVAILRRRKSIVRIGTNTHKTHPSSERTYPDGYTAHSMHAEMNVLRFAQRGDTLEVMRVLKDGSLSMAKPCKHCLQHITEKGINFVRYTNWEGFWEILSPAL